jgi:hypothetical protein
MKKTLLLVAAAISFLILQAGQVEKTFTFTDPVITSHAGYSLITFENALLTGLTGEPMLPYTRVSLLLPPGEAAESIEVMGWDEVVVPGVFELYPQQYFQPLSKGESGLFVRNEQVYLSDQSYPVKPEGKLMTSYMNGYAIALSTFTNVSYNPLHQQVSYYRGVKVVIHTRKDDRAAEALNNLTAGKRNVQKLEALIQNPEDITLYPSPKGKNDDYQLLIITTNAYQDQFQDLLDLYFDRGIKGQVQTKETIVSTMTGVDAQDKIRNYIIQEYQAHAIEYVLLGGDIELVPYRGFYCQVQSSSLYEDDDIPADLYYSALDGNWNSNGNNLWGEPGEDDLLPEVAVGRFPFSNQTELNSLKHKSILYQDDPVEGELRHPVFAGEFLWSDPITYGEDYLELLIGQRDDNGYTTIGIPPEYNFTKLYESQASWGSSDIMAAINGGSSVIDHSGHANSSYVMYLDSYMITNSNFYGANGVDHNYAMIFSHGCICGAFDDNDCIMERMVNIDNMAFSVLGNSRYGWFNEGQTEGPAAHLNREFIDALYHEKIDHIGVALAEAKIQTAPWVTAPGQWEPGALRWNFYDLNLLGDPATAVWTDEPYTIQTTYQNAIPVGIPSTTVSVTCNGAPAEGYGCVIKMDDVVYGIGFTDATGTAVIQFDPIISQTGNAELIVSGYNCLPQSYPIVIIPNTGAYVIFESLQIDDSSGNGNGIVDFGESIDLTVALKNVGTLQANNVTATLTTLETYITITDGFENYGNIAGGSTVSITNAFSFDVADNIPDNHIVTFTLTVTAGDTWVSTFNITVSAPKLEIGTLVINDTPGGNGDGVLDPGEDVVLTMQMFNTGHSTSPQAQATLSTQSAYVSITNPVCSLGVIEPNATQDAQYQASVSSSAPLGTVVDLKVVLTAGQYNAEKTYYPTIGLIYEDFETGDFSAFSWQFSGDADWMITTDDPYEGVYCARSGNIGNQQESGLEITLDVTAPDSISFFRKVSSELDYDFLRFYIDNVLKGEWSGEQGWSRFAYAVGAGTHTFRWVYSKDWSMTGGSDRACIDYIVFPGSSGSANPLAVNATATPSQICEGESSQLNAYASGGSGTYTYQWTPTTGLNNPNIPNPVASPLSTTVYTVTVGDGSTTVSDQVTLTVNGNPPDPVITQNGSYLYSSATTGNQWYNTAGAITGATGQIYYPTATDYYYVIVTNASGCSSNPSNNIYFLYTGIDESQVEGLVVYPNPVGQDKLVISYYLDEAGSVTLTLLSPDGRKVYEEALAARPAGRHSLNLNISTLEQGVYLCRLATQKKIYVVEIIKTH